MQEYFQVGSIPAYLRPAVRAREGDMSVGSFGYAFVCSAPPDLTEEHAMQAGNSNPAVKLPLKKSWELDGNYFGACTTRMPRIPTGDCQPLQASNLIDGNDETCWCSHSRLRPDDSPVWIRIDLTRECRVAEVVLKKRPISFDRRQYRGSFLPWQGAEEVGRAMARRISVKTSADALDWQTQFSGEVDRDGQETFSFAFPPVACKQILITGEDFAACESWCYAFSIASVEIYTEDGVNMALCSKGAGVTVSSVNHLFQNEQGAAMQYWLMQLDLGFKWCRIGYHDDPINWHWIEREKGVLKMDPLAEEAIDILADNGVNIVYCLNFGNRLYEGYPERRLPQLNEWYYETPRPPKSETALEAWDRFVRFSVSTFKDRVRYFEIWNEWNGEGYWGDIPDTEQYIRLAKRTIPIIRECAPQCRIMLGSFAGFVHEQTADSCDAGIACFYRAIDELAPLVDAIGYHPFYQPDILGDRYLHYRENFGSFKRYCESRGFLGDTYMASEFAVGAMYPPTLPGTPGCWWGESGAVNYSEIQKAKIIAQLSVLHASLGIQSLICELSNHDYPLELSLLRRGFDSYPIQALNPNAAYYTMRNLSSAMDGLHPGIFSFHTGGGDSLETCCLEKDGVRCLALWFSGQVLDFFEGKPVDILLDFPVARAEAVNPLNGETIALNPISAGGRTELRGLLIRDFPSLVVLHL